MKEFNTVTFKVASIGDFIEHNGKIHVVVDEFYDVAFRVLKIVRLKPPFLFTRVTEIWK